MDGLSRVDYITATNNLAIGCWPHLRSGRSMETETLTEEVQAAAQPATALRRYSPPVLIAVVVLHLLFGGLAAIWVVSRYSAARKLTFNAGPKSPNPSERALE